MRALRPDQSFAVDLLRDAMAEGRKHVVMQAPTGFGKTVLAADLVSKARAKNKHVLFTVPAISLIDQTVQMFWSQGITEVGVLQASHHMTDWTQPVQIASVQTLQQRQMPRADLVLVDEVHRWFDCYGKWMRDSAWVNTPVIGLSATPWRKGLGNYFSKLIQASTTQELIDQGLLSDFKVFAPSKPDLSGVKTVAGDYHEGQLSERMQKQKLVADAVETWLEHGRGRPTLCFAVDCLHAQKLEKQFADRGVKVAYQDAKTPDTRRAEIKRQFHSGEVEVVVNVGTLTTGVDWDVRCIILCRPTKSEMLFVQIIGRGLRTAPGKDHCLILDHSTNHERLGFVTDIDVQHTELCTGEAKTENATDRIRLPVECPACHFMKAPGTAKCPACGHLAVAHSKIEPTAGELKEMERKRKQADSEFDPVVFMAELKAWCQLRGYQPGWASNQYRDKFGKWPSPSIRDVAPAAAVSQRTASWIKSRQIAWAKSRQRWSTRG